MRILLVSSGYPPEKLGGAEFYVKHLAEALVERHDVHVFTSVIPAGRTDVRNGVVLHGSTSPHPLDGLFISRSYSNRRIAVEFLNTLKEVEPDVVHFHNIWGFRNGFLPELANSEGYKTLITLHDYWFICPTNVLMFKKVELCSGPESVKCSVCWNHIVSWLVSRKYGIPSALVRGFISSFNRPSHFRRRLAHLINVLASVDFLIAPSKFLRAFFVSHGVPEEKVIHIPNGYPHTSFEGFRKEKDTDSIVFGFVGVPSYQKGTHVAIKAVRAIRGDFEFRIYGGGGDPAYLEELKKLSQGDRRIKFMGRFYRVAEPYSKIDVLVFPSLSYENCPLVLAESALSGTPVLASNIGAIPEFVVDGRDGFLFEPGNWRQLAGLMERFVEEPFLVTELVPKWKPKDMKDHVRDVETLYS
ncbi:glycosyltransferase family 4 protein [Thermococcus radiotolerans]|uniref:Glycosyl transferase family 1 n=1 Tax=Thermococcus radiotolerans TaxID=187880 RepID=A0A2Z2NC06_9EURY|nr:glycosyltransferase family 4 protein [Thermococcus radiotolerans]ASJ15226.1 hypothetical protein A3L10_08830 [Thermococcus radiotolerans]